MSRSFTSRAFPGNSVAVRYAVVSASAPFTPQRFVDQAMKVLGNGTHNVFILQNGATSVAGNTDYLVNFATSVTGSLTFDYLLGLVDFTGLQTISGTIDLGTQLDLISAYLPHLVTLSGTLTFLGSGSFSSVVFGSLTTLTGTLNVANTNFSSGGLDDLFNALANTVVSGTGGTIVATQGVPAPPTSASATARTYLAGLGITITVDE